MNKVILALALAVTALGFSGCSKEKQSTTTTTTTTTPSGATSTTEIKTTEKGETIGVVECDVYISKYTKCIMDKVPEAARGMMKSTLDQSLTAWKQAAATPQGKQGLAVACKTALDAAKQSMGAYGCEW
jgi:hypothetical protein